MLCLSQRGGTPDAGPAFSATAFRGRCGSCTLSRKKRERREVLWIFGPSRDRGLCRRRRPIQPAGLGPLRVSSVPAHKISKRLFLYVVPLPASLPSSPTPMGRCRPFTPPLSLLAARTVPRHTLSHCTVPTRSKGRQQFESQPRPSSAQRPNCFLTTPSPFICL